MAELVVDPLQAVYVEKQQRKWLLFLNVFVQVMVYLAPACEAGQRVGLVMARRLQVLEIIAAAHQQRFIDERRQGQGRLSPLHPRQQHDKPAQAFDIIEK